MTDFKIPKTKGQLIDLYINQISEKEIRSSINDIITEYRKKPNRRCKNITHKEFEEFKEIYGNPLK